MQICTGLRAQRRTNTTCSRLLVESRFSSPHKKGHCNSQSQIQTSSTRGRRTSRSGGSQSLLLLLNLTTLLALVLAHKDHGLGGSSMEAERGPNNSRHRRRGMENNEEQAQQMSSIRLTRFQVPGQVRAGDFRRLTCQYEMQGATLHAVKLFKDNKEFYRYMANDQKLAFQVAGIQVDLERSNGKDVWLRINRRSSGVYKCQVSVENTFNSVSAERRLEVIDTTTGSGATENNHHKQNQANMVPNYSAWPYASANARPPKSQTVATGARGQPVSQSADRQQAPQVYGLSGARSTTMSADNHLLNRLQVVTQLVITSALLFHLCDTARRPPS